MRKTIVSLVVAGEITEKFYKNCGDCGKFVKKDDWIPVDNSKGYTHPLCWECASYYHGDCDESM